MRNTVPHQQDGALRIRSRAPRLVPTQLRTTGAASPDDRASRGRYGARRGPVPRDLGPLLFRHDAIGLRLALHILDILLLLIHPSGFLLSQLAAGDASFDPLLLIHLRLIDPQCVRLGIGHTAHQARHRTDG